MDEKKKYKNMYEENNESEGVGMSANDRDDFSENKDYNYAEDSCDDDEVGTDYEDLEDQWYEIANDYRERYPDLTGDYVNVEPGRFERTLDRIGRKTNRLPFQVQDIENWS